MRRTRNTKRATIQHLAIVDALLERRKDYVMADNDFAIGATILCAKANQRIAERENRVHWKEDMPGRLKHLETKGILGFTARGVVLIDGIELDEFVAERISFLVRYGYEEKVRLSSIQ